jgi:hypothetical protein
MRQLFCRGKNPFIKNCPQVRLRFEAQEKAKRDRTMMQPTLDTSQMDEASQKIYLLRLEIQDKARLLQRPDLGWQFLVIIFVSPVPLGHRKKGSCTFMASGGSFLSFQSLLLASHLKLNISDV